MAGGGEETGLGVVGGLGFGARLLQPVEHGLDILAAPVGGPAAEIDRRPRLASGTA